MKCPEELIKELVRNRLDRQRLFTDHMVWRVKTKRSVIRLNRADQDVPLLGCLAVQSVSGDPQADCRALLMHDVCSARTHDHDEHRCYKQDADRPVSALMFRPWPRIGSVTAWSGECS